MSRLALWLGGLIVLLVVPLIVPPGWVVVLSKMLIAALFALAFNLLSGQAGMLSFGHAAYFAVGVFATLHLMQAAEAGLNVPTPLMPLAGMAAGLICGVICGVFATLRSGVYFSMITLAIAELFYNLAPNLEGLFGGEGGISSLRQPFAGLTFGSDREVYYLVAAWAVAGMALMYFYTRTPFGRLTIALRENEQRVRFLGYNTYHSRIIIFTISAMFSGLAGGLLAVTNESGNYVLFETNTSATVVLHAFIGGAGVFLGPAIGAILLTGFAHLVSDATPLVLLYQGAIFMLVMVFAPKGLAGAAMSLREPLRSGRWRSLILPAFAVASATLAIAASFVLAMELLERFFSTQYAARVQSGHGLIPIQYLGYDWGVRSPLTWAVPIGLALVGILLMRFGVGMSRRALRMAASQPAVKFGFVLGAKR